MPLIFRKLTKKKKMVTRFGTLLDQSKLSMVEIGKQVELGRDWEKIQVDMDSRKFWAVLSCVGA